LVRADLCAEAVRLGKLLCELIPAEPEVWGLLALMQLHDARRDARVGPDGRYLAIDEQDQSLWDRQGLSAGLSDLDRATGFGHPGPYQLQAAITALHVLGAETGKTDWRRVAELYAGLCQLAPSPVAEVNRAVAVGFALGPEAGLELLEPLLEHPALAQYQPLHAAHADLLRRAGDPAAAARAYLRAIALSTNDVERAELERRLSTLKPG
jgi:RNA polymerase sigma-70 factor (ECF subfamily)